MRLAGPAGLAPALSGGEVLVTTASVSEEGPPILTNRTTFPQNHSLLSMWIRLYKVKVMVFLKVNLKLVGFFCARFSEGKERQKRKH